MCYRGAFRVPCENVCLLPPPPPGFEIEFSDLTCTGDEAVLSDCEALNEFPCTVEAACVCPQGNQPITVVLCAVA